MTRFIFPFLLSLLCLYAYGQRTGKSLPDYVEAAKQYSPLLHDYRNQLQIGQAELRRLKALYTRSRLELNGDYLFVPVLTKDGGGTHRTPRIIMVTTWARVAGTCMPTPSMPCSRGRQVWFGNWQGTAWPGNRTCTCLPSSGKQMPSYAFRPNSLITRT